MGLDPPTIASESAAELLRDYVAGERGQKLRSQLASKHPGRSPEAIEDAVQTACKCFLEKAAAAKALGYAQTHSGSGCRFGKMAISETVC